MLIKIETLFCVSRYRQKQLRLPHTAVLFPVNNWDAARLIFNYCKNVIKLSKKAIEILYNLGYIKGTTQFVHFLCGGFGMSLDRISFLNTISDSYSAYYDIHSNDAMTELPLHFRADFFSRAEKYWLTKSIPVWANETNEFCYLFTAPNFDAELAGQCIDFALEDGLPRVKPHKEHQYTNIKVLLVADSFDAETAKYIRHRKFSKSYKLSLHGFTTLKTAAVDVAAGKAYTNSAGHELSAYFRKLFASAEKSAQQIE